MLHIYDIKKSSYLSRISVKIDEAEVEIYTSMLHIYDIKKSSYLSRISVKIDEAEAPTSRIGLVRIMISYMTQSTQEWTK